MVGGDDRAQAFVIAVVENLKELFLCPRRCILGAEVVQNQQWYVAHILKTLVVGDFTGRVKGCAQMIKQIRHDGEECSTALVRDVVVGDGCRKVRFARATAPHEEEPRFAEAMRVGGVAERDGTGLGYITVDSRVKVLERLPFKRAKVPDP